MMEPIPAACRAMLKARALLPRLGRARQHDHVGPLHPSPQQLVDAREPRRHRRHVDGVGAVHRPALLHVGIEDLAEVGEVAASSARPYPEQEVLGLAQDRVRVDAALVAYRGYVPAGPDQLPHDGGPLHDAGVVLDVDGGGYDHYEMAEVGGSAYALEPLL